MRQIQQNKIIKPPRTRNFYSFSDVKNEHNKSDYPVIIFNTIEPNHLPHAHDFIEIVIVNSGRGINIIYQQGQPLVAGDVFVIPHGIEHGYSNVENLNITNILFQMNSINDRFPEIRQLPGFFSFNLAEHASDKVKNTIGKLLNLNEEKLAHLKTLQEKIEQEQKNISPVSASMSLIHLVEILVYLCRLLEKEKDHHDSSSYNKFSKVYDFINKNLSKNIKTTELAAIACMSTRNFQRVFQQLNNLTPKRYILKLRLEKAKAYLKNTSWDINKIAIETGFQENSYLSRQFQKTFDISPSHYRKVIQKRNY